LPPKTISRFGDKWIVDFGQNIVGHVRLTAHGPAGTVITLRHGEMLNADGSLYTANLRPALATDTFILRGDPGRATFEPHFTFHGFRYVEITGYPGELTADDLRGVVVSSDTPATGIFACSDPNLNRLFENIVWSQRGNFLSVPTDCPQRDERMGWMGDAQVFAPTAVRNADVAAFFAKWMVDVDDGQSPQDDYADVSPRVDRPQPGWPVWGDAGVIIPWVMYNAYGDRAFLADNYSHMARWVDYCVRTSDHLILSGGVGDHLAPRWTPTKIVDTAYFAHSAHIVARAAALLGKTDDAARYDQLFHDIAAAFNQAFVGPDGSITAAGGGYRGRDPLPAAADGHGPRVGDTQTAYLLALQFDLLPDNLRPLVARRLAEDVEQNAHLTTGFVGVGLICPALTRIGRSDLAWRLLLTDTDPSWLFPVKNGATTIWERWDGWTPEHGFQDPAMNSFNHYSLGSVGEWLYAGAAGIQLDEASPGYKRFALQPQFTTRLSYLRAALDSPYGVIVSSWRAENDRILYDVTIPPNSSAVLTLSVPAREVRQSGGPTGARVGATTAQPDFVENLPAGTYHFSWPRPLVR
jgi:alpha-L-rhamnosidase